MIPLRRSLADHAPTGSGAFHGADGPVRYADLVGGTALDRPLLEFAGHNVLLATERQIHAAVALAELDGVARRIVLCPPDLNPDHLAALADAAAIDAVATDRERDLPGLPASALLARIALPLRPLAVETFPALETEWVLLTSGTTGVPKMVAHTREGLTGAIPRKPPEAGKPVVWGTFYDIRRYGGLQIFFRALLGGASLILSAPGEEVDAHLARLAAGGVSHQTGTPSHWRRVLMSQAASLIDPDYVRLSGEIADQAILDALKRAYPRARIGHAYASTEAGVGFEVTDGLEGFPAAFLDRRGEVEMKIEDGSLRIRSRRTARDYLGRGGALLDGGGWVDTDDMVERRGDRCHFAGRRSGVINVGGLKVHPEEVEAVINRHARVRMSLVRARANPITGAIVVADVVLSAPTPEADTIKAEILHTCRAELPQHKVPVQIRFIDRLDVSAAGKLARPHG